MSISGRTAFEAIATRKEGRQSRVGYQQGREDCELAGSQALHGRAERGAFPGEVAGSGEVGSGSLFGRNPEHFRERSFIRGGRRHARGIASGFYDLAARRCGGRAGRCSGRLPGTSSTQF